MNSGSRTVLWRNDTCRGSSLSPHFVEVYTELDAMQEMTETSLIYATAVVDTGVTTNSDRRIAGTSAPANSPYSHISRLMATSRARTIAPALLRVSSYSREGTESATTPAPAWK